MYRNYRECLPLIRFSDMRTKPQPGPANPIQRPRGGYVAQFHMISKEYGLYQSEPVIATAEEALHKLSIRVELEKKIRGL